MSLDIDINNYAIHSIMNEFMSGQKHSFQRLSVITVGLLFFRYLLSFAGRAHADGAAPRNAL